MACLSGESHGKIEKFSLYLLQTKIKTSAKTAQTYGPPKNANFPFLGWMGRVGGWAWWVRGGDGMPIGPCPLLNSRDVFH